MISLDANVILRFLLNDVPSQTAKARTLMTRPAVYVSDVVISEVAFVLEKAMKFDRESVALLLKTLTALPNLNHNSHVLAETISLFGARKRLSFVDCYAAAESNLFGTNLYTFDKKLISHGGPHVLAP